ncbi:zygote arrest protein 1 [Sus scrofa]|uniref:Zygote arrest 1 n=2 Tax=Sus scrofa TaxID=9823 RepID=Q1PSB7_PIG|nr:zygote arrest protein 1 [Sus scrofa]ABC41758.1 zygote arrest 1 [Sus scrofa]ABC41759.1 zygote arrest 1 variant 1 [Sus scrofa]ABC41763.1 zygote arrest 1 variant 1 [Sus scrofa]
MAALGDEVLDGYMYPACTLYSYPYPYPAAAKDKRAAGGGGWRHPDGGYPPVSSSDGAAPSSFPGYGQLAAADYLHSYQRAQLMALLSQMGPGLAPRPGRVSIRDVAVQVNPRRDVSVQCSLGRRTLLRRAREPGSCSEGAAGAGGSGLVSPQQPRRGPEQGSPPNGASRPIRFPRTVAVYSPMATRRLDTLQEGSEAVAGEQRPGEPGGERGPPPARPRGPEAGEESARKTPQPPQSAEEEDEAQAAVRTSPEQPSPVARAPDAVGEGLSPRSPQPGKERLRFQFLEQKYGYYHCKDCNIRWESAYVWCVQGTNKVYYKQFCRTCQKSYNPYRVEDITCQNCKLTRCSCPVKLRHVDPKRPHRQDLCGRCKGKRLSCDSTFSFKYII